MSKDNRPLLSLNKIDQSLPTYMGNSLERNRDLRVCVIISGSPCEIRGETFESSPHSTMESDTEIDDYIYTMLSDYIWRDC